MAHERPSIQPSAREVVEELRSLRKGTRTFELNPLEEEVNSSRVLLRAQLSHVFENKPGSVCAADHPIEPELAQTMGLVARGNLTSRFDVGARISECAIIKIVPVYLHSYGHTT